MRTIPNISKFLQEVNNILQTEFIPAIIGGISSVKESKLLLLHPKVGGLHILIVTLTADYEFGNSRNSTVELQKNIIEQTRTYTTKVIELKQLKNKIKWKQNERHQIFLKDIRKDVNKEKIELKLYKSEN